MNENQEHEFPDELISAYLDGELSPAEKVRVEEQLMDSPEHRRLFEELKALRRSLQSLPAESLGEDFAARVLRRAERELLADVASAEKPKVIEPLLAETIAAATVVDDKVNLPPTDAHADRGARRGLVWSIAATAAAVGLVVFGPLFNEDSRNVSQRPAEPVEMRAAPHAEPPATPGETERAKNVADKIAERGVAENGAARASRGGVEQGDAQIGAAQAKQEGEPPLDDANALLRARDAQVDDAEAPVEETSSGARYNASTHFENSRHAAPGARGEKDRADEVAKRQAEEKAAATGDDKIINDVRDLRKPTSAAEDRFGGAAATGAAASVPPALAAREPLQAAASAKLGLVTVDLRHDAFTAKYFDRLLERHDIQVELAKHEGESDDLAAVDQVAQVPADGAEDVDNRALLTEAVEAETAEGASAKDDAADYKQKFAEAHEDVEVLYVVATQEQIDGLLLDLQAEHDEVLAMAYDGVNPAKKFEQAQAWLHRSRQLRGAGDFKELQELKEEARRASENEELAQQFHAVKPASASPTESHEGGAIPAPIPADLRVDADRADVRLADGAKSSFARRLNLPQRSAKEADIPQGGGAGGAALADPARPDAVSEGQVEEAVADDAPDGDIEGNLVPVEPAAIESPRPTADALGGPPAAPQAIRPIDGRDKLAKGKGQGLVRVLFVLRAVTTAPAVEAVPAPAEAQE